MTPESDPYKVLQVDPSADPEVIEAAYHALARKWRPKMYTSPEAAERMRQVNAAYEFLRNASEQTDYTLAPGLTADDSAPVEDRRDSPPPAGK